MSPVPLDLVADADRFDPRRARPHPAHPRASRPSRRRPGGCGRSGCCRPVRPACADAVDAVREADVVVLGPGSWFTSVIPHLLLRELGRRCVDHARAGRRHAQPRAAARRDRGVRADRPAAGPAANTPSPSADCASTRSSPTQMRSPTRKILPTSRAASGASLVLSRLASDAAPGPVTIHKRLARGVPFGARRDAPAKEWRPPMAMTAAVKDELSRVPVSKTVRAQGGTRHDAALRRRPAPHRRSHRHRGRARHRLGRAPPAQGDRRGVRARLRGADRRRRGTAQGQPLPRPGHQGRRGAGPPVRPGRPARPAGQGPAAPRRRRRHRTTPRRPGAGRSSPTARSPNRGAPARSRSPARRPRPRSRSSASAGAWACRRRRARCAAATASSSATATRSAPC